MDKNNDIISKILRLIHTPKRGDEILESTSDRELEEIRLHLDNIEQQIPKAEPDWDKMHSIIKSESYNKYSKRRKIQYSFKYVAAVAVVIFSAYFAFLGISTYKSSQEKSKYSNISSIKIDKRVAQLILADGSKIDLSATKIGQLSKNENIVVCNDSSNLLTYRIKKDTATKLEYNTIIVPRAGEYSVKLSDGTVVYLNSESELRYPTTFQGKERKVYLKGEGYFKVTKNKKRPFIVKVKDMNVEVLGTTFNINSYEENGNIYTTLVEGSVKVFDSKDRNKLVLLKPNQQAIYGNNDISSRDVGVAQYVSWVSGKFYFREMNLEDVMIQMERWYDINVFFVNQTAKNVIFTGVINREYSLNEMLVMIAKIAKVNVRTKENNIYIE